MENLRRSLRRWSPVRLLERFALWLAGGSSPVRLHPADRSDVPSRLCPTVALQSVPVHPERRRPRMR